MKNKILHIITGLSVGGAEKSLFNLLKNGLSDRFENIVISLRDDGFYGEVIRQLGIPVYTLRIKKILSYPSTFACLRSITRDLQPNIIQGWMYHGNLIAYLAKKICKDDPKIIFNIRQSLYGMANEKPLTRQVIRINRQLSHHIDTILYNSQTSRRLHSDFGFSSKNSSVIFNGFDTKIFRPDRDCGLRIRKALDIPEKARVIGHVARFHPMKDHATFLRAIIPILNHYADVHVLLVGKDITTENQLISSIFPEQSKKRLHFLGERIDIPDLMRTMDIFVQSSWSEAFPNVLGEAMSTGISCLATNVGDSQVIIGKTGFIIPPKNDVALFIELKKMLDKTDEERQASGMMARERIIEKYSLEATVNQYINLYENLIHSTKSIKACAG
ncbi:glycosyltransferase [Thiobaca trueperi]|uniref:Glycosyltransferase involved in cell wall biosynthesis n=1 Tax=Thiobaca trueperi TaxID=127458 RepID=A0A4V2V1Z9_9GAMM|nr:glycosyltransferase [Thiobaca trueperi]TCT23112.1 glycosyltransferase involved in cell wall biosynthesis [Thiobaca trueperi]